MNMLQVKLHISSHFSRLSEFESFDSIFYYHEIKKKKKCAMALHSSLFFYCINRFYSILIIDYYGKRTGNTLEHRRVMRL